MSDPPAFLLVDVSSNNPLPDLAAYKTSGRRIIAIKATEGTGYTWDEGNQLAARAHAFSLQVWRYHFAKAGSTGTAQADYFLASCGNDVPVLDIEDDGLSPSEACSVLADFCARVQAKTGRTGWVYSYGPYITSHGLTLPAGWKFWLAAYQPTMPASPNGWPTPNAWQFTDNATVPGCPAPVDQSRLIGASTTGDDMPLTDADAQLVVDKLVRTENDLTHPNTLAAIRGQIDDLRKQVAELTTTICDEIARRLAN